MGLLACLGSEEFGSQKPGRLVKMINETPLILDFLPKALNPLFYMGRQAFTSYWRLSFGISGKSTQPQCTQGLQGISQQLAFGF